MTDIPHMCAGFLDSEKILTETLNLQHREGEVIDQVILDVHHRGVIHVHCGMLVCYINYLQTPEFWCVIRFVVRHNLQINLLNFRDGEGLSPVRVTRLEGFPTELALAYLTEEFQRDAVAAFKFFYGIHKDELQRCIKQYARRKHPVWRLLCMFV